VISARIPLRLLFSANKWQIFIQPSQSISSGKIALVFFDATTRPSVPPITANNVAAATLP